MPEPKKIADRGNDRSSASTPSRGQEQSGGEVKPPGGGIIGVMLMPVTMLAAFVSAAVSTLWHDRELAAFGRQGIDELGTAVGKAFPDSIQVQETGTIWNPTQAEVTNSGELGKHRRAYSSLTPPRGWAAEEENGQRRDNGQDKSNGQDQGHSL